MSDPTVPPTPPPPAPIEIAAAEQIAALNARAVALEQELATARAAAAAPPPAPVVPPAPTAPEGYDEVKRFMARERNDRRLETVRRMGLDVPLADSQILALIPDVDPREPDGLAKLEEWRKANTGLFKATGQTQQSVVEALKPQLEELGKKSGLFDAAKLTRSVFGGG